MQIYMLYYNDQALLIIGIRDNEGALMRVLIAQPLQSFVEAVD
jgi:hypothetical protein